MYTNLKTESIIANFSRAKLSCAKISRTLLVILLALLSFGVLSCAQDSIFFDIANEPEPKDAIISGSPTNMVALNNMLFVGTRMGNKIHYYSGRDGVLGWNSIPVPGGSLGDLATDGRDLYALVFPSGNPRSSSVISKYNMAAGGWEGAFSIGQYSIQTIFGAGGRIFAGAQFRSNYRSYAIIYLDSAESSLTVFKYNTSLLSGAASTGGTIYLATQGSGIFMFAGEAAEAEPQPQSGTEGANITGIIGTGENAVAVSSDGTVYTLSAGGNVGSFTTGARFTGALCVWRDRANSWNPSLLLMGIRGRGSSLTHGYREMVLQSSGAVVSGVKTPGDGSPTSVKNQAKYAAGIGRHPVMGIMQIPDTSSGGPISYSSFMSDPDWEPPIFASTAKNGLWSYRNGEWNSEE